MVISLAERKKAKTKREKKNNPRPVIEFEIVVGIGLKDVIFFIFGYFLPIKQADTL